MEGSGLYPHFVPQHSIMKTALSNYNKVEESEELEWPW